MRGCVPRGLYGVLFCCLFLFSAQSFGQNQNQDQNQNPKPEVSTAVPSTPTLDTDDDTDSPDVPIFLKGLIDTDQYLRLRNEHIRRLRGTADNDFHPARRNGAIHRMREMERQMSEGAASTPGSAAPADATVNGQNSPTLPSQNAPTLSLPASLTAPWTPLGPTPIPNGQTTAVSMAVSGRVTAIAIHPTNENIVYVGAAQGGVFRSLDGGTTWTPIMDDSLSLAIGSVALDPLDPTTLFVGTGEGNLSGDSFFGVGLYIIKHADTVPTLLGPFNLDNNGNDIFTGRAITRVLVSPTDDNIVFVSTTSGIGGIGADSIPSVIQANLPSRGLYRSTNAMSGAPRFTKITVQPANAGNRGISDLAFDPANPNVLLAGVVGFSTNGNDGGIWRSTNALSATPTFTIQQVVGTPAATIVMKLASNTVNGVTTVLAATGETPSTNGSNCGAPGMVRRSTDGGITFSNGLIQTSGFCNTQCFYDIAPAMDPTNSSIIYLGGSANADVNPPRNTCRSNVLTRTLDGANFSRIDTGLHADTHAVAVAPSNPSVVYFGSDGGVWRSSNQGTTWSSINTVGFYATQFQSIAVHPTDRNFSIGGTQDNGTNFFQPNATWTRADFGDGGFALVDQSSTSTSNITMYHTYFNQSNNLIGYARVTTTANAHDNGWNFFGCQGATANNGFRCADSVLFYAPMALGPGAPNTLYFGTDRLYRSANQGTSMSLVSQGPFVTGVPVSAIGISPQNDNVRIVGLRNGRVFATTTGGNSLTEVNSSSFPAKYVSRAVIDPNDPNTAYVTFAGFAIAGKQIWKTSNLNATTPAWATAATGLPDIPIDGFVVDPLDSRVLYAGSDVGVFVSRDGGASWTPFGTGMPRVAVFDMAIQNSNRILRVATHGRGAWEIPTATLVSNVSIQASTLTATYGDSVTLTATVTGSNAKSPTGSVTFSDGATNLGTASLNGAGPFTATVSTALLSAGTHSITATFNGDSFFDPSTSTAISVVINPAALTVTANNKTRQYGQANPAFDGSITGIKNADNITATFTTTATPASPVGTYAITPVLSDPDSKLGNYSVTTSNGTLTITPALLNVTANNKSRTYGAANPPFDGILAGIQNGDNITATYTTTAAPASPVGTYAITPVLSDPDSKLGNYTVTTSNGTLTITPALLNVTANNKSRTYGAANPPFDGILAGIQNGDNITATYTTTATPASPVGTYAITPVLSDPDNKLGNYTVTTTNGTLTITPALLSVTANNKSRTYGAANPPFDGILAGIQNGDNITATYTTVATPASPVGTYAITPVLSDPDGKLGNYSVTTNNGTLTITPALLNVTANNKSRTYGAANPPFDGILTGIQNGDNITATYTTVATAASPVGTYAITPVLSDPDGKLGNYSVTTNNGTLTITPALLNVTANNKSRTYGAANPPFDGILAGIQNSDNITATYTTTATPASPVGTYAITPLLSDPDNKLGNYSVTTNNGTLTIASALLSVSANNKSRIYGAANPPFDGILTGIQNGDNITATYNTTATPASPVGSYAITPVLQDPTGKLANYTVTINNGTLTIASALLSVSANNKSRTYGAANPPFDGIITGIQNGDNITATYTTTATPASPVGSYAITPVLQDPTGKLGNYAVTINNGTLTVTPAALVINADNKTRILNAPNPVFTASYSGFVLGEGPSVLGGVLSCTSTAVTVSPVGSYPITCSGQTSTNYSITYVPGTLHIIYAPNGTCFAGPGHAILPPIRSDGGSTFEREADVEAEFRVCDNNGVPIGTPGTVTSFRIVRIISGGLVNTVDLPVPSEDRTSMFRFESRERAWAFNMELSKLPAGSAFVFRVVLNDGSTLDFGFNLKADRDRDRDGDRDDKH